MRAQHLRLNEGRTERNHCKVIFGVSTTFLGSEIDQTTTCIKALTVFACILLQKIYTIICA